MRSAACTFFLPLHRDPATLPPGSPILTTNVRCTLGLNHAGACRWPALGPRWVEGRVPAALVGRAVAYVPPRALEALGERPSAEEAARIRSLDETEAKARRKGIAWASRAWETGAVGAARTAPLHPGMTPADILPLVSSLEVRASRDGLAVGRIKLALIDAVAREVEKANATRDVERAWCHRIVAIAGEACEERLIELLTGGR